MDKNLLNLDEMTNEEKSKLFKVWKTLNKMMEDRGYSKNDNSNLKYDEFIAKLNIDKKMYGIFAKVDPADPDNIIRTYYEYIPNPKINMENIKDFFELMKESKVNSGIILLSGKLSQQAKQKLSEINTQLQVEMFSLNELVVNITEHELVPKHILLTPEEKKKLLERIELKTVNYQKFYQRIPLLDILG